VGLFERMPAVGAVGGEAVLDESQNIVGIKRLVIQPNGMTRGEIILGVKPFELVPVECIATCNLFTRRKVLQEVGGFDPLFFFFLEDVDLTYRIHRAGYELYVIGNVPVIHEFSEHARARHAFEPRRNRNFFVVKNFGIARILTLPLFDLAYLLKFDNVRRTMKFARTAHLGARGVVAIASSSSAVRLRGMLDAIRVALFMASSLVASYVLFLPHIPEILRSRRRAVNHLDILDLSLFRIEGRCEQNPRAAGAEANS
jgi:hypothetical protein